MSALHEQTNLPDRARRTDSADRIKARARQLGFQKVGIVGAETLSPEGAHLKEWLARGSQGEMGWMARDPAQRADPRKTFPAARSSQRNRPVNVVPMMLSWAHGAPSASLPPAARHASFALVPVPQGERS